MAVYISRLLVYETTFVVPDSAVLASHHGVGLIVAGILAAFGGSYIGARLQSLHVGE